MGFTLAELNEAIAALIPEREAIVTSRRRVGWRDLQLRTRRLAHLLQGRGLGCHRERRDLAPWESGQDHLALYLYNCSEYLEGMIGASKARVAPFNVNYRYVDAELRHILADARTRAIIYHAGFAPRLARVLPSLPEMALLLQVDDGSGEALLPGAVDYEAALAGASDSSDLPPPSEDDLYIIYTGGTTGLPKGVLWRQADMFFAALGGHLPGSEPVGSMQDVLDRAQFGEMLRLLPAPPFMHNAGQWPAFINLHSGGTVVVQSNPQSLDPDDIWRTIERERVFTLSIVGDAFGRPLVEQLSKQRYDLSSLKVIGSGGAILSAAVKQALIELIPDVMIVDGFGASETGAQGSAVMAAGFEAPRAFNMGEHTCVIDESLRRRLQPGDQEIGWLARVGHVPLGYLGDEDKTKRTYPLIGGERHSLPGDRAQVTAAGGVVILGRDSVCINSGGEKVFAEEVERALKNHPAVDDVIVTGTPSERWGEQVTALVVLRPGTAAADDELREAAAADIARYKLPRAFVFVDAIVRAPSGKPDYRWARTAALAALGGARS